MTVCPVAAGEAVRLTQGQACDHMDCVAVPNQAR